MILKLYSEPIIEGNRIWSYSPYDVNVMKSTIHSLCKKFNEDILNDDYDGLPNSTSSIIPTDDKNNNRVINVSIMSRYQLFNNTIHFNYTNNNRISVFFIDESITATFYTDLPIIGGTTIIRERKIRRIRVMKCKLGWIKSTSISKVGL